MRESERLAKMLKEKRSMGESQMGPSPTPVPPKVSVNQTDVKPEEPGMISKIGSFGLGLGGGIVNAAANTAAWGADVATGVGQDIQSGFSGSKGLEALLGQNQSSVGNKIRGFTKDVGEYGAAGTEKDYFQAGETTGGLGASIYTGARTGLLKASELASKTGKLAQVGELGLKGVAGADITAQQMEGRGATSGERALGVLLPAGIEGANKIAKIAKFVGPKEITVLGKNFNTGMSGRTWKEYISEKTPVKSIEEARRMIVQAVPTIEKSTLENIGDVSRLVIGKMNDAKRGGEYIVDGLKMNTREALSSVTDKAIKELGDVKGLLFKNAPEMIDISSVMSPYISRMKDLAKAQPQLSPILKHLDSIVKINKNPISVAKFEDIRNGIRALSDKSTTEGNYLINEITGNSGMNKVIDDIMSANGQYLKLKKDMSSLEGLRSSMPFGQVKEAIVGEPGVNLSQDVGQLGYAGARALQGNITSAASSAASIANRVLYKLGIAQSKDPDVMLQKALEFFSKDGVVGNISPITAHKISQKIIAYRNAKSIHEKEKQLRELEVLANREKGLKIADDFLNAKMEREVAEQTKARAEKQLREEIMPGFIGNIRKSYETTKNERLRIAKKAIQDIGKNKK